MAAGQDSLAAAAPAVQRQVLGRAAQLLASAANSGDTPRRASRFTVRPPAGDELPAAPARGAGGPDEAGAGRILVVDDNVDAAETLAELLRMCGYEVRCAGESDAAIDLLGKFSPQLALLDIGLPGVDGYQLAGMIRRHPGAEGMKLVALTGYGGGNDRARALDAGFDEHLVKPVAAEQLLEVLSVLLPGASA